MRTSQRSLSTLTSKILVLLVGKAGVYDNGAHLDDTQALQQTNKLEFVFLSVIDVINTGEQNEDEPEVIIHNSCEDISLLLSDV